MVTYSQSLNKRKRALLRFILAMFKIESRSSKLNENISIYDQAKVSPFLSNSVLPKSSVSCQDSTKNTITF